MGQGAQGARKQAARALEECGVDGAAITSEFGCYALTLPHGSWVDIAAAEEAIAAGRGRPAAAGPRQARAALDARSLARRRFLPVRRRWVEGGATSSSDCSRRATSASADASLAPARAAESGRSAEQIVELEPYRRAGTAADAGADGRGSSAEALTAYERCRRRLADDLGCLSFGRDRSLHRETPQAPCGARTEEAARGGWSSPRGAPPTAKTDRRRPLPPRDRGRDRGRRARLVVAACLRARDDPHPRRRHARGPGRPIDHDGSSETMEITPARPGRLRRSRSRTRTRRAAAAAAVTGEGSGTAAQTG